MNATSARSPLAAKTARAAPPPSPRPPAPPAPNDPESGPAEEMLTAPRTAALMRAPTSVRIR